MKPGAFASFVRFVVCGGGVGVLSSAAVPLLAALMPWAAANALITVASTVLCTELHALFTFSTGRRPGLREHWQSAGSATAAYAATSAAILILHTVQSSPTMLTEQLVYLSASGLAGDRPLPGPPPVRLRRPRRLGSGRDRGTADRGSTRVQRGRVSAPRLNSPAHQRKCPSPPSEPEANRS